jgi:hypothetical protein
MKIQNILRMQSIVIGLGAALFCTTTVHAQEIVNTEFNDGPYVTSFAQPTLSAQAVPANAPTSAVADPNTAVAPAIATPVVADAAVMSLESSAVRWSVASILAGFAMLAAFAIAEIRRANRNFPEGTSSQLPRRAALS